MSEKTPLLPRRRGRLITAALIMTLLTTLTAASAADEAPANSWSAELLNQILKADPPKTPPAAAAAIPPPTSERVLHTYHLTHLRVGEAGKPQNVLAILGTFLPAGSTVNQDVPANSLHVLTTAAAHQALWDYLSAVDVAEPASATTTVPEEVKAALKKLAESSDHSAKLMAAVGALQANVSNEIAQIDARQRQQTGRLLIGGGVIAALLVLTVGWMLRRRGEAAPEPPAEANALVLAPEQLTSALTPVHDKIRSDMLGLLNEVAIKLQAQHNEQQKLVREQQKQLEDARLALADERRQFISEAGSMVVQAVDRVDATTAKLAKQQDKVAELVQELQDTVRELDVTKDDLRQKEVELEQERSKIAALSILLEEGGSFPPSAELRGRSGRPGLNGVRPDHRGASGPAGRLSASSSCTNHDQTTATTTSQAAPSRTIQFLPPEHPET